jgi:hypothetical protein
MIPLEELRAVAAQKDYEVIETRRQTSEGVFHKLLVVTDKGKVFEAEVLEDPEGPKKAWHTLVNRFLAWKGR